ncbi:T9SS type A sorting domain-containing protein [Lacinutrix sp. C3R15]|uniref:T9SS type A sorting domain-containing protein n=1 Tax=Flavobacteriaceae TaxID=49546 RepID=UPI001C092168|nr:MULTISPECIES: T9SS type A sorting domain-containing protein [Flavobacteriaceae]MBU2939197.1 T9SS type A sorting domain-containing protein [Lacinutrix sp. C3R15]MDO6622513.1 T9SS type A sorting domain-containing protein [Oceanihabitans sp. 1_MG-2023]
MKKLQSKHIANRPTTLWFIMVCFLLSFFNLKAQVPDSELGLRAEWMRGALGLLWLPERNYNGNIEGVSIDDFITQINDLRTIDYVQLPLTSPNIFSPVHVGPHPIIESLWEGDTDTNGNPINLVVPRASAEDPLLNWLQAVRAAGLRTEIYVNSYNLLARFPEDVQEDYPDVSDRWKEWCDTNTQAQTFINSQAYYDGDGRRKYMFCYAEFILKEYAMRYGDLIDAWCFDSADNIMEDECGDDPASDVLNDQRIYQAFADACHAGNPNAAIAFNNSVGDRDANPFTTATYFDDYTFGHPFGGAGNMVEPRDPLYGYNFGIIEWMEAYNGYAFTDDTRTWNDNVISHFFPKQSTTSWNAGNTPCLTDEEFVEWTTTGLIGGGAITWGTPLVRTNLENNPVLTLQPYALTQFELTDTYLKEFQYPGAPNWSRQYTILPPAYSGIPYSHTLTEGFDFWDPEGDAITSLIALDSFPSWLTITETTPGVWTLSGTPFETVDTDYEFDLRVSDATGASDRTVELKVFEENISEPTRIDVQIQATENTTYPSGAVIMTGIGSIPEYDTTFEINITVTPNGDFTTYPNAVIVSGTSDNVGNSSTKSWGISDDGTNDASNDRIFAGDQQFSATINNATVGNITGTSGLTSDDITIETFKSITIVNAQSVGDRFTFSADESVDFELGRFNNEPTKVVDLVVEAADTQIESFTIKNGSTATNDKWSVEGVTVTVLFHENSLSVVNPDSDNEESFRLFPNPAKNKISLNKKPAMTQVFDIAGKLVKVDNEGKKELNISALNQGVYILKIKTISGNVFFKKFIKR